MSKIKLPDGVGIAIQGPTNYVDLLINFWPQFDCPITWGTWSDEPIRNILKIERAGIEVVIVDKPEFTGFLNCNLQFLSSHASIEALRKYDVKHVLKMRSDCVMYNLEQIWPIDTDISFMFSYNPKASIPYAYCLDGVYHMGLDFPADHAFFGKIDTVSHVMAGYEKYWNPAPPESIILKRWLDLRKIEQNFDIQFLKENGVHYWGGDAVKKSAEFIWLKPQVNMTSMLIHENYLRMY